MYTWDRVLLKPGTLHRFVRLIHLANHRAEHGYGFANKKYGAVGMDKYEVTSQVWTTRP